MAELAVGIGVLVLVVCGVVGAAMALTTAWWRQRRVPAGGPTLGPLEVALVAVLVAWNGGGAIVGVGLFAGIGVLLAWAVAGVVGMGSALVCQRRCPDDVRDAWRAVVSDLRASRIVCVLVGAIGLGQLTLTGVQLAWVGDVGWDAANYHLPIVGSMIQNGSLFDMPRLMVWQSYPALVETQAALFGRSVSSLPAASLAQFPSWIWLVAFVGVFVHRRTSWLTAATAMAVVVAIPTSWVQVRVMYTDIAYAALLVAAVVTIVAAWRDRSTALVVMASAVVGCMAATKWSPAAAPLALACAAIAARDRATRRLVPVVALLVVLPVAPYLVRNQIEYDEPLYPLALLHDAGPADTPPYTLDEMNHILDDANHLGLFDDTGTPSLRTVYLTNPVKALVGALRDGRTGEQRQQESYSYDGRLGGFGAAWLALLAAAFVLVGVRVARGWRPRWSWRSEVGLCVGLVAVSAVAFVATRVRWWPRYTFGFAVVAVLVAALVVGRARRVVQIVVLAGVMPVALASVAMTERVGGLGVYQYSRGVGDPGMGYLTDDFAPLVVHGARTAVAVDEPPGFSAGMWGDSWRVRVSVGDWSPDGPPGQWCPDALVVLPSGLEAVLDRLATDRCGTYEHQSYHDWSFEPSVEREVVVRTGD